MKNNYSIEEDFVRIFLKRQKSKSNLEALIDLEDFDKINSFDGTFYGSYDPKIRGYYVKISLYEGTISGKPKYNTLRISRIILNITDITCDVDHINGDTLDNRKPNLRVSTRTNNSRNRKTANSNNKTGIRNVCFYKGLYLVQMQVEGKNKCLKKFENIKDAEAYAKKMREKYYGEFSGDD